MTISKPVIAAGRTYTREQAETVVVGITSTAPPGLRKQIVNGVVAETSQDPQREGQMLVYKDGTTRNITMYVVVKINNILEWKTVLTTASVYNKNTGEKWDPNAGFYNPLAT